MGHTPNHLDTTIKSLRDLDITVHIEAFPGIVYRVDVSLPPEGYLVSGDGESLILASQDAPGKLYGMLFLQRLAQFDQDLLFRIFTGNERAFEAPRIPVRAYMLDISRNRVPTQDFLKLLVRTLAHLQFNQLQLYTEHTFAYTDHEKVWRGYSPMTPSEIQELDQWCRDRAIELVPNQNSLGHLERWFEHEEYHYLAEAPQGYLNPWGRYQRVGSSLCPILPESVQFLEGLYTELLPNFSSRNFHIGCDEVFDIGHGRSSQTIAQDGMDAGKLYLEMVNTICDVVHSKGFSPMIWGDMLESRPDLIPYLHPDVTVVCWWYEGDGSFNERVSKFSGAGIPTITASGTSSWMSLTGRWENAKRNITEAVSAAITWDSAGCMLTDWGDHGHWNPFVLSLLPMVYAGRAFWYGTEQILDDDEIIDTITAIPGLGMTYTHAKQLISMGRLVEEVPCRLHNTTPWQSVLIQNICPDYSKDLIAHAEPLGDTDWNMLADHVDEIISTLQHERDAIMDASQEDSQGSSLIEQSLWCLDMTRLGLEVCKVMQREHVWMTSYVIDAIPESLKDLLIPVMKRFKTLWSGQSREGGLERTLQGMRTIFSQNEESPR